MKVRVDGGGVTEKRYIYVCNGKEAYDGCPFHNPVHFSTQISYRWPLNTVKIVSNVRTVCALQKDFRGMIQHKYIRSSVQNRCKYVALALV